jgi:hypothetical protein
MTHTQFGTVGYVLLGCWIVVGLLLAINPQRAFLARFWYRSWPQTKGSVAEPYCRVEKNGAATFSSGQSRKSSLFWSQSRRPHSEANVSFAQFRGTD